MYLERITRSVSMLPVCVHQTLPITNLSTHMLNRISKTRLYLKFTRHPKYCLVSLLYFGMSTCIVTDIDTVDIPHY